MRTRLAMLWRVAKWWLAGFVVAVLLLLVPVAYVEVACRGERSGSTYAATTEPGLRRNEANTYLTYPEWHIVYAYDGLAERLTSGDEHTFGFISSITGFWKSTCSLMRAADAHGGAGWSTRIMIHTIGVSFTAEMALKGAYEETIGRATAWLRGPNKTPQDLLVAGMAVDYAAFLRQTPWYRYPFRQKAEELWNAPVDGGVRGWERRIGIGAEFTTKAAYARVLAGAAAAAPATLVIRSVVTGLDRAALNTIPNVAIIDERADGVEIETPRYDQFTRILGEVAHRGGRVREIAGNDDIMVTLTVPNNGDPDLLAGRIIMRLKRDGFAGDRLLIDLKVSELTSFINAHPLGDPGLEHVFDY
jgi:hypothetical protein